MKKTLSLLIIGAFVLGTVASGWALWGTAGDSLEGTVKSISADMITITSQSADGQQIKEVSLEVTGETQLGDIASLDELKAGDEVKVSFKEEGDKKIAVSVARAESVDSAPEQMDQDPSSGT